jgi:hypothetical protein
METLRNELGANGTKCSNQEKEIINVDNSTITINFHKKRAPQMRGSFEKSLRSD